MSTLPSESTSISPIFSNLFEIQLPGITSDLQQNIFAFEINNQQLFFLCNISENNFVDYLQNSRSLNIIHINIGNKNSELITTLSYKVVYVGYKFNMDLLKNNEICNIVFEYKIIRDITLE